MNQILHIFKKDARRHWPEILISIALLALFTRHELHPWQNSNAFSSLSPYFFILATRPLLCTLSACVVVGEPHQKLWPALINCCLHSLSRDRNRLVSHENPFQRHGKSAGSRRAFPGLPSLGICRCGTRLAVR